ncbi:GNAT family N-acetyltransferase [Saccharopolyspora spinosa]|uniref:L-amino acid N-acyltransferase YncA n=1 Tax=Saccharopolyspora spinosa TaxID=60894 RepID=A0A2N3YAL2_SACSN|nr:GNAT family N-acetyltransferase [Saccharopolyspora spinosa]PKW19923.1 L-amino acid N-acyltransferase YncA [Saccharopolyspora spinosa]
MIRRATRADVRAMVELVHELARYEKAPELCHLTEQQLRDALFAPTPALFGHVAEVDGAVAGLSLWFLNFSTWEGVHGIYLEDLYVRPEHRGSGLGKALLQTLAQECVQRGYARLEWSVLNWNEPSINFYKAVGAIPMDEWTAYRLTGDALRNFSA